MTLKKNNPGCGCCESCDICCTPKLPATLKITLSGSTGTYSGSGTCPGNCSDYDGDYIVELDSAAQYAIDGNLPGCCRENTAAATNCKWRSATFNTPCYYGLFNGRRFFLFMTSSVAEGCVLRAGFDYESFAGNACAAAWKKKASDGGICAADLPITLTSDAACGPHPCDPTWGTLTVALP